eukprot:s1151_g24.t1
MILALQLHAQAGLEIEVVDFSRGGFVMGHISEVAPGRILEAERISRAVPPELDGLAAKLVWTPMELERDWLLFAQQAKLMEFPYAQFAAAARRPVMMETVPEGLAVIDCRCPARKQVNLTAVRKILKKFDKKIPPEFRTRKVQDYKVHHELFMPSMQHALEPRWGVLVTAVQMQRLIAETVAESGDLAVPISQLGPESLAVLSCIQNRNVAVDDVFGYSKPGKIDVYAKPMSAAGAVASRLARATQQKVSGTSLLSLLPQFKPAMIRLQRVSLVTSCAVLALIGTVIIAPTFLWQGVQRPRRSAWVRRYQGPPSAKEPAPEGSQYTCQEDGECVVEECPPTGCRNSLDVRMDDVWKKLEDEGWWQRDMALEARQWLVWALVTGLGVACARSGGWPSVAGVVLLALANTQAGWLAHDYIHGVDSFADRMRFMGPLCAGMSPLWHHAMTNEIGVDEDIATDPVLFVRAPDPKNDSWHRRIQHLTVPLSFSMLFVVWRTDSIKVIWNELRKKKPRKGAITEAEGTVAVVPWNWCGTIGSFTQRWPMPSPSPALHLPVEDSTTSPRCRDVVRIGTFSELVVVVLVEPVLVGKSRRRGGRNNRKRGSRKDFEKSQPQQPQQPQPQPGKGKAKGRRQSGEEPPAAVPKPAAGPAPCEQNQETMKVAVPAGTQPAMMQQMMPMPVMHMAQPRFTPMYGGLPLFVPKAGNFRPAALAGQGKGGDPPIAFGGDRCGGWILRFTMVYLYADLWMMAGLAGTAGVFMEANCQANWMPAKEIRALFEWVDPNKGETRELLREKHGEDETVQLAATEDASDGKGWLSEPTIGLSDFACLYGNQEEEAEDEGFSAQVAEARQHLEAADEKLQAKQKAKEDAEAALTQWSKDMDEVMSSLDAIKDRRLRAEEALKDKRSELTQARREESAAQTRLDKANKSLTSLQDKLLQQQHSLTVASEAFDTAVKSATEAAQSATSAGESFGQALSEASKQLDLVDQRGCAAGDCAADAAPDRLRKALKAMDKLKNAIDNNNFRENEFQTSEENLLKLEPGRERDRHRLEQLVTKAQQRAEASREAVLQAVQTFVEAGMLFAESLQKTQKRPVKMEQVKAVQSSVKGAFRQLPKAWQAVKSSQEAQCKAGLQRRKASSRLAAVTLSKTEAESQVEAQQKEHQQAEADESQVRGERCTRESELAAAEEMRQIVDAEEAEAKKQREELKASQSALKEALKAAKSQEREADNERKALHARASKREKEQEMLEEAKNTAVKHLKAEEYDARQVEQAYSEKRGAKKGE